MLNRYIYTDKELEVHYQNKVLKPKYKTHDFLDHKMHYAVFSKNDSLPLLVLIHGAPGAWYGYMNLADDSLLQANYKIIAVDRLGYGKSDYGKEELSTQLQALAIKSILETENTSRRKVYLLGRSYGAPIAAWLAINYPQEVEKLIMVSPVIDPTKEKFYWFSKLGNTAFVQWMLPDLLNVATKEKFSHQKEMKGMIASWQKLYTPTYVLVGENDEVADTANYSFAKNYIMNCPAVFMKLKNTGHLVSYQQPTLIKQLLLDKSNCEGLCLNDLNIEMEICYSQKTLQVNKQLRSEHAVYDAAILKRRDVNQSLKR
jgi:pimeloyl-ACP methyl ester carboxylesterase